MHTVQSDIFYQGNNYHFVLNISTGTYQSLAQSFNKPGMIKLLKIYSIFTFSKKIQTVLMISPDNF